MILRHSTVSYSAILYNNADHIYYAIQGGSSFCVSGVKSQSMTIQMKATEQYFPVVLFIMLYKVVLTFESVDDILKCNIQMKAIEQDFPVVLF